MKDVLKVGEVAQQLKIKKSLVRQWKQQFEINPSSPFYTVEDVKKLRQISALLKNKSLSVEEVKNQIHAATSEPAQLSPQIKTESHSSSPASTSCEVKDNTAQIISDITARMLEASLKNVKTPAIRQEQKVTPAIAAPKEVEISRLQAQEDHATSATTHEIHAATIEIPAEAKIEAAEQIQARDHSTHKEFLAQLLVFKEGLIRLKELLN